MDALTHRDYREGVIEHRRFVVEAGDVQPAGSWVYVWFDLMSGEVAYIGATAFEPEYRAHVHMTHPDPQLGRVKNEVTDADRRSFVVRAFAVPSGLDRTEVKSELQARLVSGEDMSDSAPGAFADQIIEELRDEHHLP